MRPDRQSVAVYASNVGLSVLGFLSTVYFARHPDVGASGLGVYFLFEAVLNMLAVFNRVGLLSAVEQRISASAPEAHGEYLAAAFVIAAVPYALIAVGAFLFRPFLESYIGAPVVPLLVATLAVYTGGQFLLSTLRAEGAIALASGLQFSGEAVRVGVGVVLVYLGWGPIGLIYAVALALSLRTVASFWVVGTSLRMPTRTTIRSLLDFSRFTAGTSVSSLIYGWLDTLVLGFFLGPAVVGVYETAWRVAGVVVLTGRSIATVLFPKVSGWYAEDRLADIVNAYREALTYALLPVIPAVVGAVLLGRPFLSLVFQFETGAVILAVLVGGKIVESVNLLSQRTLLGVDRPSLVFRVTMATLVANLILDVVLVMAFGGVGAAVATVVTVTLAAAGHTRYLARFVPLAADWRALRWQLGAAVVMGVVVAAAGQVLAPTSVLRLSSLVALGVIVYGISVLAHRGMRERLLSIVPLPGEVT